MNNRIKIKTKSIQINKKYNCQKMNKNNQANQKYSSNRFNKNNNNSKKKFKSLNPHRKIKILNNKHKNNLV